MINLFCCVQEDINEIWQALARSDNTGDCAKTDAAKLDASSAQQLLKQAKQLANLAEPKVWPLHLHAGVEADTKAGLVPVGARHDGCPEAQTSVIMTSNM